MMETWSLSLYLANSLPCAPASALPTVRTATALEEYILGWT